MAGGIQWTDKVFHKLYWLPLCCYFRPDQAVLTKAIRFFMYHYKEGTGRVEDWENVLMVLLLDLKINNVYVVANEDNEKKETNHLQLSETARISEAVLESLAISTTLEDNDMTKWYRWCFYCLTYNKLELLATYFGTMSMFLCNLITHDSTKVKNNFEKVTLLMAENLKMNVNEGRLTPAPGDELFGVLAVVFKRLNPFAKNIICRLTQRQIELQNNTSYKDIKTIHDISCYSAFERNGNGLLYWFFKACNTLKVTNAKLLSMLKCIGDMDRSIETINKALPQITKDGELGKTWAISRLLRNKSNSDWANNSPQNFLAVATFVAIAYNIESTNHSIWNSFQFKKLKQNSSNIEWGISIAKSLKRTLLFEKKHRSGQ